jgi:hypothetical protein
MATLKKRKVDSECRIFQERWAENYFFIEYKRNPVCLICLDTVPVFKECNLKRHYNTKLAEKYEHLRGQIRKDTVSDLREKLTSQQTSMTKSTNDSETAMKASYAVSKIIAKRLKQYADEEFVKECLEVVRDVICPEKNL